MKKIIEDKYFKLGLTVFLIIVSCITFYFIVEKVNYIILGFKWIIKIFTPFIIGFTFAYLLNPLVIFFEDLFKNLFLNKSKLKEVTQHKISRFSSITITCIVTIGLTVLLFSFVIPELLTSIETLVMNIPMYLEKTKNYLLGLLDNHDDLRNMFLNNYDAINNYFVNIINETFLPKIEEWITIVSNGLFGAVKVLFDVIMGFIIAIYFLYDKEIFKAQLKKTLYSIFNVKFVNKLIENGRHTDQVFGNFIVGKILETFVFCLLSFIFLAIFGYPYALLISVIIGITNIIPYFGPYIGGIPSAFLVLLQAPDKFWPFIIFLVVIQQIDNYVIGPFLTGTKIGIKSFWVLFAIMIFGGIFGLVGMLIGVPLFALLYGYITNRCNNRLVKKKLPTETYKYDKLTKINSETNKIITKEE
ncbi:MAG: AI-2E family transporter [Mollicutes bacterium]|nr:AI-2E family transporter [Mollicutes bacterium]